MVVQSEVGYPYSDSSARSMMADFEVYSNGGQHFGGDPPKTPQRGEHDKDQGNDEDIFIGETPQEAQIHCAMRISSQFELLQHKRPRISLEA